VTEPRALAKGADRGELLAAEVSYVDRARSLLSGGQSSQGLALLESYERQFREARLLPEVLFLQFEAYERAGRYADARRAAQRLVASFPTSPHAGRARKLLGE
jgi:outer membrane protein assembly factor BamD (BamD/ComL family)